MKIKTTIAGIVFTALTLNAQIDGFTPDPNASWMQPINSGGWYMHIAPQAVIQQDVDIKSRNGAPVTGQTASADVGSRLDIAGGFRFSNDLALQVEAGVSGNHVGEVSNFSTSSSFDFYQVPLIVSGVYTFTELPLKPFVGAGAGGAYSFVHETRGSSSIRVDDDLTLAFQATAGFTYEINKTFSIGAVYKYLKTGDHDFGAFETEGNTAHSFGILFALKF